MVTQFLSGQLNAVEIGSSLHFTCIHKSVGTSFTLQIKDSEGIFPSEVVSKNSCMVQLFNMRFQSST
jgi:hypothetical protein